MGAPAVYTSTDGASWASIPTSAGLNYTDLAVLDGALWASDGSWVMHGVDQVDTAPPAVTARRLPDKTSRARVPLTFRVADPASGVAFIQVRVAVGKVGTKVGQPTVPGKWRRLPGKTRKVTLRVQAETKQCAAVRATDNAGNTSRWTRPTCVTRR